MLKKHLVNYCAPTLAGIKTGSLFSLRHDDSDYVKNIISQYNKELNHKDVFIKLLSIFDDRALIYVYRGKSLENDIADEEAADVLSCYGYDCSDCDKCIKRLSERIEEVDDFPHEIGLFLGYPIDDVKGFIKNGGQNCKFCGCWKVYCNESEARKKFAKFKKCTQVYRKMYGNGTSIIRLTVPA